MKALFYVLNEADKLHDLIDKFEENGIKGCTIFDSSGMGREYAKHDKFKMMGSLRALLNPDFKNSKTLMLILEDSKVNMIIEIIESVVGNLDEPGTGVVFTFPIDFAKGLKL